MNDLRVEIKVGNRRYRLKNAIEPEYACVECDLVDQCETENKINILCNSIEAYKGTETHLTFKQVSNKQFKKG